MILFTSDYTEGAHPRIIEKLAETNMEQTVGYGEDPYCEEAREAIKKVCEAPEADVHFLVGGTQTNFTVISSILRPFQGVICADSGHINVHETGAVEAEKRGADYLGVGAVFPTGTKEDAVEVGKEVLKEICEAVSIPVVAIGGVGAHNVEELAGSGISGIAVISALFAQPDIEQATKELKEKVEGMLK